MRILTHLIATLMLLLTLVPQTMQPANAKSPAKQCSYVCTKGVCKMLPVCAAQKAKMKTAIANAATAGRQLEDEVSKIDCAVPQGQACQPVELDQEKASQLLDSVEESLCLVFGVVKNCTPPSKSTKDEKAAWKNLGEMDLSALDRIEHIRQLLGKGAKVSRTTLQAEVHELVSEVYGLNTLLESSVH